jgi:hypothetical protein
MDDWQAYIQQQINNAEAWAQQNPLATSIILIVVTAAVTYTANKAYDAWTKR